METLPARTAEAPKLRRVTSFANIVVCNDGTLGEIAVKIDEGSSIELLKDLRRLKIPLFTSLYLYCHPRPSPPPHLRYLSVIIFAFISWMADPTTPEFAKLRLTRSPAIPIVSWKFRKPRILYYIRYNCNNSQAPESRHGTLLTGML